MSHPDPYLELQNEFDRVCADKSNVLLFGDFNSRTATLPDICKCDEFLCNVQGNEDLYRDKVSIFQCFNNNNVPLKHSNADTSTNSYGYQFVEFCKNNNIFILNGRVDFDSPKLTCKNSSTVDYMLSSAYNLEIISFFNILEFDNLFSDTYCPVTLDLHIYTPTMIKEQHITLLCTVKQKQNHGIMTKRNYL